MKKWVILSNVKGQGSKVNNDKLINILLGNRGISGKRQREKFLQPSLDDLTIECVGLKKEELEKGIIRIKKAIDNKESVVVYTDYDADGICSGAIIWETLYDLGIKVMPYVPHREKEGYGLSKIGIDFIKKEYNPQLIITVDHGISSRNEINYAQKLGIETIILDHHLVPPKIPKVVASIHTTKLASGGIAWFFSNYLQSRLKKGGLSTDKRKRDSTYHLDLAALSTIADLVPLVEANRTIVKFGLERLNKTDRPGLNAMIKEGGLRKGEIGVYEVGHILAPRINAAGRLTHALDALRLICTKDAARAADLAGKLGSINKERQVLSESATQKARELVRHELLYYKKENYRGIKILLISSKEFNEGIIGLVAGKLAEEFYRPAIVISEREVYSKASARSISGFDIVANLRKVNDLLINVGGHPMAAGFTVATRNVAELKEKLQLIASRELDEDHLTRVLKIDTVLDFSDITKEFYDDLQRFAPFGMKNPEPIFATYKVKLLGISVVGRGRQHLKMKVQNVENSKMFDVIGFGMAQFYRKINPGILIDIAYTIDKDNWNGKNTLQLKLKDVKFPAS